MDKYPKPTYRSIPTAMKAAALKSIGNYYKKEHVKQIFKECYVEQYPDQKNDPKEEGFTLIYPAGGDDWSFYKNRKTGKFYESGHGCYFGKLKTKAQALKKK
ncbi:MAG TPA: hypothetical protein VNX68_13200 [Nitrosopumilaceae archaeon]|jgi:hypothetical protein|nr:hypothetical protein [Nitrosopumilaceae archaeon]